MLRGAFKTRAAKLEKAFKAMGHVVEINKEKPRKGAVSNNLYLANPGTLCINISADNLFFVTVCR